MKIALITIHRVTNYGALLQAFATKVVLSQYGTVQTIDYQNPFLDKHMAKIRFEVSIHGIKMLLHDILNYVNRVKVITKFNHFINNSLNLSRKVYDGKSFKSELENFDIYVCGSDQIWNPRVVNKNGILDEKYFLSFANPNSIKFSYASSIGHHNYSLEEKDQVYNLLNDFKSISVRESDGVEKIKRIFPDRLIHHVVDPTLLLTKEQWFKEFDVKPQDSCEDYILVYSVPRTKLLRLAITHFAKKLKLKVVAIDRMFFTMNGVDKHINNAGPKEFIQLYANASFVITDSFHGTCFALNFKKPFVAIAANERVNRQVSLLKLLGLENRLVYKEADFNKIEENLDYNGLVNSKFDSIRDESLKFIEKSIS